MASYLSVFLQGKSHEQVQLLAAMLERESRPVFEDDMQVEYRHIFSIIEDIEFPESCLVAENELIIKWFNLEGFSFKKILPLLSADLAELILACEIPDDPLSFDEDVEEGWYWYKSEDGTGYVQVEKSEVIEKFGKKLVVKLKP